MSITIKQSDIETTGGGYYSNTDTVLMGDAIFPMLYVYFMGTGDATDGDMLTTGLENYLREVVNENSSVRSKERSTTSQDKRSDTRTSSSKAEKEIAYYKRSYKQLYRMFKDAAFLKNRTFIKRLANAATQLNTRYLSRLPMSDFYWEDGQGGYTEKPVITDNMDYEKMFQRAMQIFYLHYEYGTIDYTYTTDVRAINIYTGEYADRRETMAASNMKARLIGYPATGQFRMNQRPKSAYYQHTFSGVDVTAVAAVDTVVSELNGLTSISWSVHRGKATPRTLGKAAPAPRARGSRTIAGSMIFSLSDHHPLLDLIPDDYPVFQKLEILNDPDMWRPGMMADQIPPFDLSVIMTNEYGYASILSLYGIDVVDEGGVIAVDNLVTELTVQYTAVAMDPIVECAHDEVGMIDPYGLTSNGYSKMFKQREVVINGVAYSDLGEAYEAQYDGILGARRQIIKR